MMPVTPLPIAQEFLPSIRDACIEAGRLAMDLFRPGEKTTARIWAKSGGSPVTEADIGVDTFLRVRLSALLPEAAWLSEETVDDELRLSRRYVWVVDPIDGTRAYMNGSPDWAVCAALLDDSRPIVGVVHAPASQATYVALAGGGATRNGKPLLPSAVSELAQARIAGPKPMLDALARHESFVPSEKIPSLALRLARIADGTIDAGLISTDARDWDIAAAALVLSEADGSLTQWDGEPVRYNRPTPVHGALVASAPGLVDPLAGALRRMRDGLAQQR